MVIANKSAVVFAGYFPTQESLSVGEEFINYFVDNYSDCFFYVGLNSAEFSGQFLELLNRSGLDFDYAFSPVDLVLDSDASAYQAALCLMRNREKFDYAYVHFFHSKGATNPGSKNAREIFMDRFKNREHIERSLCLDDKIGTYSLFLGKTKRDGLYYPDKIGHYFDFQFPYFYTYLYFHTIFSAKGYPVGAFIKNCSEDFFSKNLEDRYFFERDFPHVIWRQGYVPYAEYLVAWNDGYLPAELDINSDIAGFLGRPLNFIFNK